MSKALINHSIVGWAVDRANVSPASLALRLNVHEDAVNAWISGEDRPTFIQAQKLATALSIPFGYLYLPAPPNEETLLPDFRTVGSEVQKLDVNTKSLLGDIMYKRDWYKEYKELNAHEPISFVGKFTTSSNPKTVAIDISGALQGEQGRPKSSNHEDYLRVLMTQAENLGIWVMRTGIVGNNTHRPLSVSTFRGLAISDPIVPMILINGQDSSSAQIFTFAHELAHLWLGESAVSNVQLDASDFGTRSAVEKFCNKVAAEFLTPEDDFRAKWNGRIPMRDQIDFLASHFKVSRAVIARRALDFGFIEIEEFRVFFSQEKQQWQRIKDSRKGGGDFFNTLPVRNGRNFTRAVAQEAMRGSILLRQAASLLGVQPGKLREIYERV